MVYKTRPGIELLNLCGTSLLAATRPLWRECPRVRPLPKLWAAFYGVMSRGKNSEEAMVFFVDFLHIPREKMESKMAPMMETLAKEGFLIPVEDEE